MSPNKPISVAIVEDDAWVRENLAREIGSSTGFECGGSYATAEAALAAIPLRPPEVAVLDINLPGIDGIECLRRLRASCSYLQFLMLTSYEESEKIFQSLRAGANGYLLKRADTVEVIDAIRQVYEGGAPMSSTIARQVVRHFNQLGDSASELPQLSPREREVLAGPALRGGKGGANCRRASVRCSSCWPAAPPTRRSPDSWP